MSGEAPPPPPPNQPSSASPPPPPASGPAAAPPPPPPPPGTPGSTGQPRPSFPPPAQPDPAAAAAKKKRLLVGGGAAAGVLVLVLILVVVLLVRAQQEKKAEEAAPGKTVQRYLDALAKGDAKAALGTLSKKPVNDDLLTDEVLEKSNDLAPITGIKVSKAVSESYPRVVRAQYKIGDQQVYTTFRLVGKKKSWKLVEGTGTLRLSSSSSSSLKVQVNGAEPPEGSAAVFPGSYQMTTDSKYISFGDEDDGDARPALVSKPGAGTALLGSPTITESGLTLFRDAVVKSASACLASKKIDAGCGLSARPIRGSGDIQDGTIVRSISATERSSLSKLTPRLGTGSDATVATAFAFVTVDLTAQCSGGPCVLRGIGLLLDRPTMDLAASNPTVVWK